MIGMLDQSLQFNGAALRLRAERQQVLAANIANADTPGFKAADFDFGRALEDAARASAGTAGASGTAGRGLAASAPGHIGGAASSTSALLAYRTPAQGSIDGNTVEMDAERARFADNAVRYEASLRFINGQVKTILSAIQG